MVQLAHYVLDKTWMTSNLGNLAIFAIVIVIVIEIVPFVRKKYFLDYFGENQYK